MSSCVSRMEVGGRRSIVKSLSKFFGDGGCRRTDRSSLGRGKLVVVRLYSRKIIVGMLWDPIRVLEIALAGLAGWVVQGTEAVFSESHRGTLACL